MQRYRNLVRDLSSGAITLGVLQAFGMLNWAEVFTNFLAMLFSVIAALLFGGAGALTT
jgi:hypothetical protein